MQVDVDSGDPEDGLCQRDLQKFLSKHQLKRILRVGNKGFIFEYANKMNTAEPTNLLWWQIHDHQLRLFKNDKSKYRVTWYYNMLTTCTALKASTDDDFRRPLRGTTRIKLLRQVQGTTLQSLSNPRQLPVTPRSISVLISFDLLSSTNQPD